MQGFQHVSGHQHGGREVEAVGGDHAVASTAAPRHSASCDSRVAHSDFSMGAENGDIYRDISMAINIEGF